MTDDALFSRALAHVLAMEGGYTEDPYDPGGPTNLGITLAEFARDKGVAVTADTFARLKAELKALPAATAARIYRTRYWEPGRCPDLPPPLAFFHFDAAVNQGVGAAARMLQEAVGAAVDGVVGADTLARAAAQPVAGSLARYADIRRRRYRALATFWRFGKGWLARVDATLAAASALPAAATALSPSPTRPKEPAPMTDRPASAAPIAADATIPPATIPAKWWGSSMTVWGVLVTALSTVLPVVGPLLGLDISADLARQLGEQAVAVTQAAGGLAGTILTIYGRARATTALERRQVTLTL
ncbi:MAG TPA: glycosyl hydrolase 108 family protein [Hyphomicrobiaceae bacterium]|jgi:lysozyme family protein